MTRSRTTTRQTTKPTARPTTKPKAKPAANGKPESAAAVGISQPELLSMMAVRLVRAQNLILASLDESLTYRQYVTLLRIHGGLCSIVGLAAEARLTLPTVSQSVDSMVKRGLIARGQDKMDRRLTVLTLTAAGVTAMRAAKRRLEDELRQCLEGVDAGVRENLMESFETIGTWATGQLDAAYGAGA